jgi:hypothetical protein
MVICTVYMHIAACFVRAPSTILCFRLFTIFAANEIVHNFCSKREYLQPMRVLTKLLTVMRNLVL